MDERDVTCVELLCGMDETTLRLYQSLTPENRQKVDSLIATLRDRQSSGQR
jgi:hypothetical protein